MKALDIKEKLQGTKECAKLKKKGRSQPKRDQKVFHN